MSTSMDNYGRDRGLACSPTGRTASPKASCRQRRLVRRESSAMSFSPQWEWGAAATFTHDELSTDKRHPTANANGTIYGVDWANDDFLMVDPVEHTATRVRLPVSEEAVPPGKAQSMPEPSPYWGNKLYWYDPATATNMAIDSKGRVWMPARFRKPDNQPAFCKGGSSHPSAKMQPIDRGWRQLEYYDPKTRKFTMVDTCFDNHHVPSAMTKPSMAAARAPETSAGWTLKFWIKPHDAEKAQGWCGGYFDINGNGKYDPDVDKKVADFGDYGVAANPKDNSGWAAIPGVPGHIVRIDRKTCATEIYEPPFNNPNAPGKLSFGPRGIDVDTNGIVWTALAGSSHMASFDRTKCKIKTGPAITDGQHCPEGWTLYPIRRDRSLKA